MSAAAITPLRPMLAAAVRGAESLEPADRADVFEGIAIVTRNTDEATSQQATELAQAIRDSEGLMIHFRKLFTDPETPTQSE